MKKEFHPIGTIVELKEAETLHFMIIGMAVENNQHEYRDYVGVRYPMGFMNKDGFYFFNHNQIVDVVHMGYESESHKVYEILINKCLEGKTSEKNM